MEECDISSTDIRLRASKGKSLKGLVTDEVAEYIKNNKLYRGISDAV